MADNPQDQPAPVDNMADTPPSGRFAAIRQWITPTTEHRTGPGAWGLDRTYVARAALTFAGIEATAFVGGILTGLPQSGFAYGEGVGLTVACYTFTRLDLNLRNRVHIARVAQWLRKRPEEVEREIDQGRQQDAQMPGQAAQRVDTALQRRPESRLDVAGTVLKAVILGALEVELAGHSMGLTVGVGLAVATQVAANDWIRKVWANAHRIATHYPARLTAQSWRDPAIHDGRGRWWNQIIGLRNMDQWAAFIGGSIALSVVFGAPAQGSFLVAGIVTSLAAPVFVRRLETAGTEELVSREVDVNRALRLREDRIRESRENRERHPDAPYQTIHVSELTLDQPTFVNGVLLRLASADATHIQVNSDQPTPTPEDGFVSIARSNDPTKRVVHFGQTHWEVDAVEPEQTQQTQAPQPDQGQTQDQTQAPQPDQDQTQTQQGPPQPTPPHTQPQTSSVEIPYNGLVERVPTIFGDVAFTRLPNAQLDISGVRTVTVPANGMIRITQGTDPSQRDVTVGGNIYTVPAVSPRQGDATPEPEPTPTPEPGYTPTPVNPDEAYPDNRFGWWRSPTRQHNWAFAHRPDGIDVSVNNAGAHGLLWPNRTVFVGEGNDVISITCQADGRTFTVNGQDYPPASQAPIGTFLSRMGLHIPQSDRRDIHVDTNHRSVRIGARTFRVVDAPEEIKHRAADFAAYLDNPDRGAGSPPPPGPDTTPPQTPPDDSIIEGEIIPDEPEGADARPAQADQPTPTEPAPATPDADGDNKAADAAPAAPGAGSAEAPTSEPDQAPPDANPRQMRERRWRNPRHYGSGRGGGSSTPDGKDDGGRE